MSDEKGFEDMKLVIRRHKSNKDRQYTGQKKRNKITNNYLQELHRKLHIGQHEC